MPSLNIVVLAGHLTRDCELRHTTSGQAICAFGLAVGSRYKDSTGNWVDGKTMFIDVNIWGASGEKAVESLRKGSPVTIKGRLDLQQWEKDGVKKSKHSVTADFWMVGVTRDPNKQDERYEAPANDEEIPF